MAAVTKPVPMSHDVSVSGNLGFSAVVDLWRQTKFPFSPGRTININLAGVTGSGSAALALLLQWTEQAREQQSILVLKSVPEQLAALIHTNELDFLLD